MPWLIELIELMELTGKLIWVRFSSGSFILDL